MIKKLVGLPASVALAFIRWWQKYISPIYGDVCRFKPTCSHYTYEAIEKYGFIKGSYMGFCRICRCNPLNKGGYDPVQ